MKSKYLLAGLGGVAGAVIAAKFLTRSKSKIWEQFSDVIHHAERSHFVEVDGIRVHYQEFGDRNAPPVVMLHGFGASTYTWKNTAPRLADKGFRVLAVDMIGFGFTEKPNWGEYTISSQARMIVRFMNRMGIGCAIFFGSSYGGAVAATVALDYPERVEKLVLVGAPCNDDPKSKPVVQLARLPIIGDLMSPFLVDSRAFLRFRLRESLAPESHHLIDDERLDSIQRPLKGAADAHHSMLMTLRNWRANRIERDAHLISQPTLLVWGEKDIVVPIQNGHRLHRSIPNSRLVVFKQCGHLPHEEYTDNFVELTSEFCHNGQLSVAGGQQLVSKT
jgi:pimeloyl-ACP methyl ester carboxylesterase